MYIIKSHIRSWLQWLNILYMFNFSKSYVLRFGPYTDILYWLLTKKRSNSKKLMSAYFIFLMSKWASSVWNNIPFIPQGTSQINFKQFELGFLFNTVCIFSLTVYSKTLLSRIKRRHSLFYFFESFRNSVWLHLTMFHT